MQDLIAHTYLLEMWSLIVNGWQLIPNVEPQTSYLTFHTCIYKLNSLPGRDTSVSAFFALDMRCSRDSIGL